MSLPVWLYWEGPRPAWIRQCHITIVQHAADARPLDWADFDALWSSDRDLDLAALFVAQRADFIRAYLLAHHGGLWIDSDCIVMRPLDDLLDTLNGDMLVAHRERQGQFSNAFLGAAPGSALARRFYDEVARRLRSGEPLNWTALGGGALGALLAPPVEGLRELACAAIQPVCWSNPGAFFARGTAAELAARVDRNALTYMLSNSTAQGFVRDNPGADLMAEETFFRHLVAESARTASAERQRRAVWSDFRLEQRSHGSESLSGPGSSLEQSAHLRAVLPGLLQELEIASMLDAPCGDHHWLGEVELACDYLGLDILPELIEANRRRHPERRFEVADLVAADLPRVDLVLCRDALVHFPFALAFEALRNLRRSGATWLLATSFVGRAANHDIAHGEWRALNLECPPFAFPRPELLLMERCSEGDDRYRDKALGLWRLAELPLD